MKKRMQGIAWALVFVAAPALAAQGRAQGREPGDTGRAARMQRMEAHMKTELGLTDDQAAKLHATWERFQPQRRKIMERQRAIHEALRGQLKPGVAANGDSVSRLLDAGHQNRAALAQLGRDADRDLAGYLTPVQRARVEMMHERMMMRGRMHGRGGMGGMRGGMHWKGGHGGEYPGGHMRPGSAGGGGGGDEDQGDGEDGDE